MSLSHELNNELFAYIIVFIKNKNCFLYRINAMEDHIHILFDLHPNIALADFMRDLKTSTSFWLKLKSKYPNFEGWADACLPARQGYAALTYSFRDKEMIINYIKNQQEHHKKESFKEELRRLLEEQGVKIDERFFP
jgi:REP element-mobilizing transposase RayT